MNNEGIKLAIWIIDLVMILVPIVALVAFINGFREKGEKPWLEKRPSE